MAFTVSRAYNECVISTAKQTMHRTYENVNILLIVLLSYPTGSVPVTILRIIYLHQ